MAKSTTLAIPQTTKFIGATIVNATSFTATNPGTAPTNTVLVATAGSNDSIIKHFIIASDDSSARNIQFWISSDGGTTKYLIATAPVPANSGATGGVINVDVLAHAYIGGLEIDETGKAILRLPAGTTIYAGVITAAVTANKTIWIIGTQLDY